LDGMGGMVGDSENADRQQCDQDSEYMTFHQV
jgi:hypothetical protein